MQNVTLPKRKTALFQMRIAPEEKAAMEKAAEANGVSLACFLRAHGLAAAKSLGDQMAA